MALECLRTSKEGVLIDVHVLPGSKKESVDYDPFTKRLRVKISAPAVDGKANKRVLEYFKNLYGNCAIVSGDASRRKTLLVTGSSIEAVSGVLEDLME